MGVGQHWALLVSSLADEASSGPCLMTLEKLLPLLSVSVRDYQGLRGYVTLEPGSVTNLYLLLFFLVHC